MDSPPRFCRREPPADFGNDYSPGTSPTICDDIGGHREASAPPANAPPAQPGSGTEQAGTAQAAAPSQTSTGAVMGVEPEETISETEFGDAEPPELPGGVAEARAHWRRHNQGGEASFQWQEAISSGAPSPANTILYWQARYSTRATAAGATQEPHPWSSAGESTPGEPTTSSAECEKTASGWRERDRLLAPRNTQQRGVAPDNALLQAVAEEQHREALQRQEAVEEAGVEAEADNVRALTMPTTNEGPTSLSVESAPEAMAPEPTQDY